MSGQVHPEKDLCTNGLVAYYQELSSIKINLYKPGNIGKQNSPRYDAAKRGVPSGAVLVVNMIFI